MDGRAALFGLQKESGIGKTMAMTADGLRDLGRAVTRRKPHVVPIVGEPGSNAVIAVPGALSGYEAIVGPMFRNEMPARGILRIAANRPVRSAAKVSCPTFIVVAENDNVVPVASVHEVARRIGAKAEVLSFPCGHFDIYVDDIFEKSSTEQTEFLRRVLV
jgi:pimeloyl-ACP methyl ester carboxylesterase